MMGSLFGGEINLGFDGMIEGGYQFREGLLPAIVVLGLFVVGGTVLLWLEGQNLEIRHLHFRGFRRGYWDHSGLFGRGSIV